MEILKILFPKSLDSKKCVLIALNACAVAAKDSYSYFQQIFREYNGDSLFFNLLDDHLHWIIF